MALSSLSPYPLPTSLSLETFLAAIGKRRVALVYPALTLRAFFLSHLFDESQVRLLYYGFGLDDLTPDVWVRRFVEQVGDGLAPFDGTPTPTALAEWLAAAGATVVYLDCIDHLAPDAEFIRFLTMWVRALPDSVKLAVSSCALTRPPWDALLSEGLAAFVDVELRRTDWAFRAGAPVRPQLECLAFGRGQMCVNGQPIQSWEGVLPRALAFYLIDNPLVSRLEIFEAFWPNVNGNDATNVFHVTKRKVNERISASIGDGKAYELTHYALGFYSASDGLARHYDVEDFCQSVEQALVCEDERRQTLLFLRAIDLYRAPFLQTVEMPWVVARRQDLHRRYVSALVGVGRAFARRGDNRAVMYLSRAVREAPEREDVHRDVIELYVRQGMYAEAEQHLQMLAQRLHEAGGLALPPELVALRAQMRNRHAGA